MNEKELTPELLQSQNIELSDKVNKMAEELEILRKEREEVLNKNEELRLLNAKLYVGKFSEKIEEVEETITLENVIEKMKERRNRQWRWQMERL